MGGSQRPPCAKGRGPRTLASRRRWKLQVVGATASTCASSTTLPSSSTVVSCDAGLRDVHFSSYGLSGQAVTLHLPVVLTVFQQEDSDHTDVVHGLEEIAACENDVYFSVMSVSDILISSLNHDLTCATDVMIVGKLASVCGCGKA